MMNQVNDLLERTFKLSERKTTVGREIRGGFVTFFAMSYILVLNPIILSTPDSTGHFLGGGTEGANTAAIAAGTALVAGVLSILMGSLANFPIALAAGLGLNAMLAYSIVSLPGMTWADAMGVVVIEGILILVFVLTGLREAIFKAVPAFLKTAISVGIGLFIALIGLVNAGIIRTGSGTPLDLGIGGSIASWPLLIFIIGLFIMLILMVKQVRGAILIGIVVATIAAIILESIAHLGPRTDENPGGWGLTVPALGDSVVAVPNFSTIGEFSIVGPFEKISILAVLVLCFSLLLADFFDTMGTMVAVGAEGDLLDEKGNPPRTRQILIVDSLGAIAGGAGGVSSNTSYIESATGVADGARTGLASITTGLIFLACTFLSPLAALVPYEAATPALVVVGFLMMQQVGGIDWRDLTVGIPAFLTIAFMPFAYSITVGIGIGFISYVVLGVVAKKKIHPLLWVVSFLFVLYFLRGPIETALGL